MGNLRLHDEGRTACIRNLFVHRGALLSMLSPSIKEKVLVTRRGRSGSIVADTAENSES